jgi:hypothetical protein
LAVAESPTMFDPAPPPWIWFPCVGLAMVSANLEFWFFVVEQGVPAAPGLTAAGPVVAIPVQPVPFGPQFPGI